MTIIFDILLISNILYIMSKKPYTNESSISLSFEARSVWIQLASLGAILIGYGAVAGRMLWAGVLHIVPYVPVFAVAVALLVIFMIVGHTVSAITSRPEGRDERDKLIVWRAERSAGWVLGVGRWALACWRLLPGSSSRLRMCGLLTCCCSRCFCLRWRSSSFR